MNNCRNKKRASCVCVMWGMLTDEKDEQIEGEGQPYVMLFIAFTQ